MLDGKLKEKIDRVRDLEAADMHHIDAMYAKPSHNERKRILLELMAEHVGGKCFLDVGCAEGMYCQEAHKLKAASAMGLDISARKIERAKELFPELEFKVIDSDNLSELTGQKFDFVLCTEVLQHICDYKKTVGQMVAVMADSGLLLISVPNLSKSSGHTFADINEEMTVEELLKEIGGAGHGRQNAVWKFNTEALADEFTTEFPLELVKKVPVDTPDGQIKNLWTVFLLRKKEAK